jgi:hypothetical protein
LSEIKTLTERIELNQLAYVEETGKA